MNNHDLPQGGPRTPEGKARSRGNAIQHGLTATTLLHEIFGSERLDRFKNRFKAEWQPESATQEVLVLELARHAAALEWVEQAELPVLRFGAVKTVDLLVGPNGPEDNSDLLFTAAVSAGPLDCLTRFRRAHEKGFHTALSRLREGKSRKHPLQVPAQPENPFASQEACEAYLLARLEDPQHRCCRCGHHTGYWLVNRQRWECAGCRRQIGLRAGTIMAGSHLPLRFWFQAIQLVAAKPLIPIPLLADQIGLARLATVRHMAQKIRNAMAAPQRTEVLAGLDRIFIGSLSLKEALPLT